MADKEDTYEVRWMWRISMPWSKVHVASLERVHDRPGMMLHAGYEIRGGEIIDHDKIHRAMAMTYWSGLSCSCVRCHGRGWTILEVKDHKHAHVSACPYCNPNGEGC